MESTMQLTPMSDMTQLSWILRARGMPDSLSRYCEIYYPYIDISQAYRDRNTQDVSYRPVRWSELVEKLDRERLSQEEGTSYQSGFRMRFLPNISSNFVAPEPGTPPQWIFRRIVEMLEPFTGNQCCYFYSFIRPPVSLREEDRRIYCGGLSQASEVFRGQRSPDWRDDETGVWHTTVPEFWWPRDHSWCVNVDFDLPKTLVGGSSELITELLADDQLEVYEVRPELQPYRHWVRLDGSPW